MIGTRVKFITDKAETKEGTIIDKITIAKIITLKTRIEETRFALSVTAYFIEEQPDKNYYRRKFFYTVEPANIYPV